MGFPQTLSPLAPADDVLIASSGADIVALSVADGTERWRRPPTEQEAGLFWFEPMGGGRRQPLPDGHADDRRGRSRDRRHPLAGTRRMEAGRTAGDWVR